jgi:hypothetical protein
MAVTRRRFLTEVAAAGGVSLAYEAMTALHRRVLAGK